MQPWQRQLNALRTVLGRQGLYTLDEVRRANEDLGAQGSHLGYWDRSALATRTILVEREILDAASIEARSGEVRARLEAARAADGADGASS